MGVQDDLSNADTADSFGSFDVDEWPSTITGQQESVPGSPQYAAAQTGPNKSPLVELRNKKLSLNSQDSFYDQPYTNVEELGAGFTSFGPPPPPAFRSNTGDSSDSESDNNLAVNFMKGDRMSFTNELYRAARKPENQNTVDRALDTDEEVDSYLDASRSAKGDEKDVHGIENKGARSDSAEPAKANSADDTATKSDEMPESPVYAKPDMTKKTKHRKMKEEDEKSSTSSVSGYHLVDEKGKAVHDPVVVYDERTNL